LQHNFLLRILSKPKSKALCGTAKEKIYQPIDEAHQMKNKKKKNFIRWS
jgi:hypothetical protein